MNSSAQPAFPFRTFAASSVGAFFLLGLIAPVLGPALPALSEQFSLSATRVSLLLSLNAAGSFAGVVTAGLSARRWGPSGRGSFALVVVALACLGLALAPSYAVTLLAASLLGFGFGVLDLTFNVWIAASYGDRSAAMLNLLSAGFGVGAVLSPLIVGFAGGNFRTPLFVCVGLAAALLPALFALRRSSVSAAAPLELHSSGLHGRVTLAGFIALFLLYVGAEGGIGAWEITHLQDALGFSTGTAAQTASLFWLSFTVGRVVSAPLALRLEPARLITGTLVLAVLSIALAAIPQAAPVAYTLAGLFLAPVFTTGLVWLTRTLPSPGATTWAFASAFLGPVAFAPLVGGARDLFGPAAVPLTLSGVALLTLLTAVWLQRRLGRERVD